MSIFLKLFSTGECEYNESIDIYEINKKLRPLGFEAILWYDKSKLYLKDLESNGYRGISYDNLLETVKKIIDKKNVDNEITRQLENDGHISEGSLNEKFFIQNEDFLIKKFGFHKCEFCKIICAEGKEHVYCRDLFEKMKDNKN
ncbi:hypothetical protein DMUE_3523 [Dictyocoela muelleri]|nr:hypothetical protein DMUE_3523 [Dictyocoela muelleri]